MLFLQDSHYFFLGWSSSFRVPARVGWRLLSIEMSSNLVSYFKTAFSPKRHVNTQKKSRHKLSVSLHGKLEWARVIALWPLPVPINLNSPSTTESRSLRRRRVPFLGARTLLGVRALDCGMSTRSQDCGVILLFPTCRQLLLFVRTASGQ